MLLSPLTLVVPKIQYTKLEGNSIKKRTFGADFQWAWNEARGAKFSPTYMWHEK
jgi:hypothetical protein